MRALCYFMPNIHSSLFSPWVNFPSVTSWCACTCCKMGSTGSCHSITRPVVWQGAHKLFPQHFQPAFHHTQCEQATRKGQNFSVNQPLLYTEDSSGTAILSLVVLFHKKNTLPSINLCCESTGSSIFQKSNYWLFPAYSFCGCSWSVCSFLIRAKVMTQLLSSAFPENNNIPVISTTSAVG